MRMINADAVYKILESCEIRKATIGSPLTDWEYGYTCGIERAESEIECAPTIDTIPVEWIRKYIEEYPYMTASSMLHYWSVDQALERKAIERKKGKKND